LRFYFESSARAHYVDTKFGGKTYEDKDKILAVFKPMKRRTKEEMKIPEVLLCEKQYEKVKRRIPFRKLLVDIPNREQLVNFYDELCDYVHLSEIAQTDALRFWLESRTKASAI